MSLTPEQKRTVAEWIGWQRERGSDTTFCRPTLEDGVGVVVNFDLNDAALCVEEMGKRDVWENFEGSASFKYFEENKKEEWFVTSWTKHGRFFAWLMTMESGEAYNFFAAIAAWIEEEK